jgi:hypothetical protein
MSEIFIKTKKSFTNNKNKINFKMKMNKKIWNKTNNFFKNQNNLINKISNKIISYNKENIKKNNQ